MTIKFEDNGRQYEGHVWVGPTDRDRCERCDKKTGNVLPTGIGIHFRDAETGHYVVTGRSCYTKLTGKDVKLASLPVIGMGFAEAQFRTNTKPRLMKGKTATEFDRSRHTPEQRRLDEAIENAWIRVELEEKFGVQLGQLQFFKRFLEKILSGSLSEDDVNAIQRYVGRGISQYKKPTLEQVRDIYVVAFQLSALQSKRLYPGEQKYVRSMEDSLRRFRGLSDNQMLELEKIADRHGVMLSSKDIRFPENEARVQKHRPNHGNPKPKKG